ncbi:MAG: HU family DNA-binding protein [Paludibacteraceae bacterium]|nr:HU family DNA-binding protein [Paludibacteraceae bacterium]
MTKADLVSAVAMQTGVDKTTTQAILDAAMRDVKNAVANDEPVFLRGFGTFNNKLRAQKLARNIARNTSVLVPAHKVVTFKPSPEFTNALKV